MSYEITRFPYQGTIDADGHVLEPGTLWEDYLEPRYRDRALRIRRNRGLPRRSPTVAHRQTRGTNTASRSPFARPERQVVQSALGVPGGIIVPGV
jgi:hypothetical protein